MFVSPAGFPHWRLTRSSQVVRYLAHCGRYPRCDFVHLGMHIWPRPSDARIEHTLLPGRVGHLGAG